MRSCLWKLAPCKLTALLLWASEKRAGNQHKIRPEVVLERLWNLLGPGLPRAAPLAPVKVVYLNSPLSGSIFSPAARTAEASGSWSPFSRLLEGWYSTSQSADWRGEVSAGRWSFPSAVAWSSSWTPNYNFHLALRFWLPILRPPARATRAESVEIGLVKMCFCWLFTFFQVLSIEDYCIRSSKYIRQGLCMFANSEYYISHL